MTTRQGLVVYADRYSAKANGAEDGTRSISYTFTSGNDFILFHQRNS